MTGQSTTLTQAGTLQNSGTNITTTTLIGGTGTGLIGTQSGYASNPQIPPAQAVGESLMLVKTGDGEFVLTGTNAQRLLMEYFEQAPEMWLRLMAIKAEEDAEEAA